MKLAKDNYKITTQKQPPRMSFSVAAFHHRANCNQLSESFRIVCVPGTMEEIMFANASLFSY